MAKKHDEIDFVFNNIVNIIHKKRIILPEEIKNISKNLSPKGKKKLLKKLADQGYKIKEGIVERGKKVVVSDKIKENKLLSYLIKPDYVNTESEYIQVGTQYYKGIVATGFPVSVSENWLGDLTKEKGNIDFSIFIEPSSVRAIEIYLNNQLKKIENDLFVYEQRGQSNISLQERKKEISEQLSNLISGKYKLFKMSLYLAAKGFNEEDANMLGSRIINVMHSKGIEAKYTAKYHESLLKSIIPAGRNYLDGRQILVPGPAAAASFPFSSSFYDIKEEDGILLGFNDNNIPVAKSIWDLPKYVGAILGSAGSGKSYSSKALILNEKMVNGTKIFILDPENEYVDMCKKIPNSQVIKINRKSNNIPNIFDLAGEDLMDKLVSLPRVFQVLLGGVTETQKPLLEQSIIKTYYKKGIKEDNKSNNNKTPPRLSDLFSMLKFEKKKARDRSVKEDYEILISKLSRYTSGIFKFMDKSTKGIDAKKDFTVFEFKTMPEELRSTVMTILLEFLRTRFRNTDDKKMLVIDEAWRVLKNKHEAEYIENFARVFRKDNGSLLLITQSVAELSGSPEGKAYLANSAFTYVLKTEGVVLDETAKLFGLNDSEKDVIYNARQGEGILIWGGKHNKVRVEVDPDTHDLITTNPDELKKIRACVK